MSSINSIIDFLENRALQINNDIKRSDKLIGNYKFGNSNQEASAQFIKDEILKTNVRLATIKKIVNMLQELSRMNIQIKSSDKTRHNGMYNSYINKQVNKIINNNIPYNEQLALYGFEPFYKKLMKQYLKTEDFERCTELQSHIPISDNEVELD